MLSIQQNKNKPNNQDSISASISAHPIVENLL